MPKNETTIESRVTRIVGGITPTLSHIFARSSFYLRSVRDVISVARQRMLADPISHMAWLVEVDRRDDLLLLKLQRSIPIEDVDRYVIVMIDYDRWRGR